MASSGGVVALARSAHHHRVKKAHLRGLGDLICKGFASVLID
jgi:hypothetical protein